MIGREELKRAGSRLLARVPVYKALPAGKYRDFAAIHHLSQVDPQRVAAYLSTSNRLPDWRYSSLQQSAQAMLAVGEPDKARVLASRAVELQPERAEAHLVLADLEEFAGNTAAALRHAQDAWLLEPLLQDAAGMVVRLAHLAGQQGLSDEAAVVALQRFQPSTDLLWTACKSCESREHLIRIRSLWRAQTNSGRQVSASARALALAALHLEWFDLAQELYIEACMIEIRGDGVGAPVKSRRLAGKDGLLALRDLRSALESAGIPFFFAAGTVLGIIRDGRPLDHDDDIDVGIFQEHWDREALVHTFTKHPYFKIEPTMASKPKLRLTHRSGASVDIFKFYRQGENVFHEGNFVRWRNTAFDVERHEGSNGDVFHLPSDPDRYLTENYGNWKTPDPDFDAFVHGPNMEVTSEPYWRIHRLRRVYKFLRALQLDEARQEMAAISETLAASEAGRALLVATEL